MRVALTFDAEHPDRPRCPPGAAEGVLDVLAEAGVRATFFLQGRWAQAQRAVARRIAAEGHLVGSHSFYHARMPLLSDEGLRADIGEAERAISESADADPRPWFRCPWGDRDDRVLLALRASGYRPVGWDVVAEDWEEARSAEDVERDTVAACLAFGDGAVVLFHTWPESTPAALPRIVRRLGDEGASFFTVAELERDLSATADPGTAAENPRA